MSSEPNERGPRLTRRMRPRSSLVAMLLLIAAQVSCVTPPPGKKEPVRDMKREEQLNAIRGTYKSIDCFNTSFRVSVEADGKSQSANGTLRVDNKKQRMRFVFSDTIFGITLMRITINAGTVEVYNPHAPDAKQRQTIPLERFAVSGLGQNSIVLPFRLFQDLLFARIPPDVFQPKARVEKKGISQIAVTLESPAESYVYEFEANRLRGLRYLDKARGAVVDVALLGTYEDSSFPERIAMKMNPERTNAETMEIRFRGLDLKAACTDDHFPKY